MANGNDKDFTHLSARGEPAMVNVDGKPQTYRTATARAIINPGAEVMRHLNGNEIRVPKGPVFQTAVIAGIMAAKRTSELIPLCHPLGLDDCKIDIRVNDSNEVIVECKASLTAKTGVEMEALTGASVAALTIYDMCKALSHDIVIREIR
ncbi:MAG: cyclic pyranopterin monophosphate synthase MoaC, partial [Mucilaginibacter polytrichastri]|nr:cyclic pyranopterin monophosphate synthase MoaC [Mucilaginibacter polytrichastri]